MNIGARWSYVAFVAVPLLVWMLAAVSAWRKARGSRLSNKLAAMLAAFVAGGDGRLSLSRAQAFVWTLVIYGAYAAAFVAHVPYESSSAAEAAQADTLVIEGRRALARADSTRRALKLAAEDKALSRAALETALADSTRVLRVLEGERGQDAATESARVLRVAALRVSAMELTARTQAAKQASEAATSNAATAVSSLATQRKTFDETRRTAASLRWVAIPVALLALAGLSIGTGVLSNIISNATDSGGDACVTSLATAPYSKLSMLTFPELGVARRPDWPCAVIYGRDFGRSGYVRFGNDYADILYWSSAGTVIVVQVPPGMVKDQGVAPAVEDARVSKRLVVDSVNGKRAYGITGVNGVLQLGEAYRSYDWLDLFRDDRNPAALALTKFQMFGWTVIAVGMYVYSCWRIFGRPDAPYLEALPDVDPSLVILMGVSQAAYLTGKAMSNVGAAAPATPATSGASAGVSSATTGAAAGTTSPLVPATPRVAPPGPLPSE